MHSLSAFEPAARVTVVTLFNSLWEAALLAFAVWAILRLLPNLNATTRYAAWCVALVGSLLLPLATAIPQISVQHANSRITASVHGSALTANVAHTKVTKPVYRASSSAGTPARANAPRFTLPERLRFALPGYVALALFGAWGLATLLLFVRLAVNLWRLEHLKRDALPLPLDYRERLAQWAIAEKGEREIRLCICDRIEVPVAVGLFDSMILIPRHLLDELTPEEIDQIMLHELGHLRRADDWTNGLQRVIQALFFFNPAILYIAQQLDVEREVACDDWVVHQTKSVRPYATCLTKMAEVTAWPHRALAAPGVFVTRRGLSVRVERLLRAGRNVRTGIAIGPAGTVVAALVVLFFALQSVAPSFAFTTADSGNHFTQWVVTPAAGAHKLIAKVPRGKRVAVQVAQAAPSPVTMPATPRPASKARDIKIPAQHIHIPARTLPAQHIPAINIDIPERQFPMPAVRAPHTPKSPKFRFQILDISRDAAAVAAASAAAAGVAAGAGSSKGFNCVGCDYSGQNLAGHSFRGQRLNGTDFSHANLQNADFSNAIVLGGDFSRANLQGANFSHAVLNGCDLSHANLAGVNFDGVQMVGCSVDAHSLSPSQARALIYACHTGCDFSGANLNGQNLRGVSLIGVDLSDADLRGADFTGAKLSGVDLRGAKLDGARFSGAAITGCDLSGIDLSKVDLSNAKLNGDKLTPNST